jgi:hypothetical protein
MCRTASLPRRWVLIVVCLSLAVTGASARQTTRVSTAPKLDPLEVDARRAELEKAIDAYAAGDHAIVSRIIHEQLDPVTRAALTALMNDRHTLWNPARAAFTLEVAVVVDRGSLKANLVLPILWVLRDGRTMVVARPTPIGKDPAGDRFEMLWHQIALALLQSNGSWNLYDEYVTAVAPRMERMAKVKPPVPGRFALARAVNASVMCCRAVMGPFPGDQVVFVSSASRARPVPPKEAAFALFDLAVADPVVKIEALVRGAFLEWRLGRLPQALARLDRALPVTDETLAYVTAMIRGGVFDQEGKPAAAAEAYAAAQRLAPEAQVPVIGRAAALQRAGLIDDAISEAARARRMPEGGSDPWPGFMRGDARFITDWMIELRRMLR